MGFPKKWPLFSWTRSRSGQGETQAIVSEKALEKHLNQKKRMTVEDARAVEKRIVLVAIRIDHRSRELLNWALVKVAEPGDQVVALHVVKEASVRSSTLLDTYLEDYEGLCHVKQVGLSGQISLGSSVKRVLVREARKQAIAALVVGISKKNALRSWASMARYCAKRLSSSTEVVAVHKGKVIFRSCSCSLLQGLEGDPRPSIYRQGGIAHLSDGQSNFGDSEATKSRTDTEGVPSSDDARKDDSEDWKADCLSLIHDQRVVPLRSSLSSEDLSEEKPGWPLQRSFSLNPQALEARKLSVVQWVMALPNRSPPETPTKSESPVSESPSSRRTESSSQRTLLRRSNEINLLAAAHSELQEELELLISSKSSTCQWYNFDVLRTCTSCFSSENMIGKGGSNRVYKGFLPNGKPVAVKILSSSSKENCKDFALELEIVLSLRHKNILPLIGICIENNHLIFVYDYLHEGSLEHILSGNSAKLQSVLSWEVRFNIAVQIAEALNYLHDELSQPVIHRDVKSSNILLSNAFEPQLSDFGLAIWGPKTSFVLDQGAVFGTFGYLAPEYFMYGKISDKIDVYSFGVVLLELLSGRKSVCFETPKGQESLVVWAKPLLESGDLRGILDPSLHGSVDGDQVQRVAVAAKRCVMRTARLRPRISQILSLLKGEEEIVGCVLDSQMNDDENVGEIDDEVYPESCVESHLSLALLDLDDNSTSSCSLERGNTVSVEDYLKDRSQLSGLT